MQRSRSASGRTGADSFTRGHSLIEVLVVLVLAAVLAAGAHSGIAWLEAASIHRSADLATAHLRRARVEAVASRQILRVQVGEDGLLLLLNGQDSVLAVTHLQGDGFLRLDSLRLRPATLRYNPRGHASPGSLYLYRGDRGIRLVSNFLGRVRRERIGG